MGNAAKTINFVERWCRRNQELKSRPVVRCPEAVAPMCRAVKPWGRNMWQLACEVFFMPEENMPKENINDKNIVTPRFANNINANTISKKCIYLFTKCFCTLFLCIARYQCHFWSTKSASVLVICNYFWICAFWTDKIDSITQKSFFNENNCNKQEFRSHQGRLAICRLCFAIQIEIAIVNLSAIPNSVVNQLKPTKVLTEIGNNLPGNTQTNWPRNWVWN